MKHKQIVGDNGTGWQRLRQDLQQGTSDDLWRRRTIIGLSLVGMASMTAVSLLQTGIVRHLPDPPLASFNSDKVNSSKDAYRMGVPDGTIALATLAANIPLAAVEAVAAGRFFYLMPAKEKAWCGYCIVGALTNFGILALTLPEARKAFSALRGV